MALTIEDGTGVSGADSFVTLAEYATAQTDLFGAELDGTDAIKEAALRRAWYYLKSLSWKRDHNPTDPDAPNEYPLFAGTIPADVKTAQAVLARYEQATPNGLAPNVVPGQQKILTRVGEIGWTATGQTGVSAQRAVVTMAADLLKPYVNAGQTTFLLRG